MKRIPPFRQPRQRGRWVVIKERTPDNPNRLWLVILWGGNGAHVQDGASFRSWRQAYDAARKAASVYRANEYADHTYQARFERRFMR